MENLKRQISSLESRVNVLEAKLALYEEIGSISPPVKETAKLFEGFNANIDTAVPNENGYVLEKRRTSITPRDSRQNKKDLIRLTSWTNSKKDTHRPTQFYVPTKFGDENDYESAFKQSECRIGRPVKDVMRKYEELSSDTWRPIRPARRRKISSTKNGVDEPLGDSRTGFCNGAKTLPNSRRQSAAFIPPSVKKDNGDDDFGVVFLLCATDTPKLEMPEACIVSQPVNLKTVKHEDVHRELQNSESKVPPPPAPPPPPLVALISALHTKETLSRGNGEAKSNLYSSVSPKSRRPPPPPSSDKHANLMDEIHQFADKGFPFRQHIPETRKRRDASKSLNPFETS